MDKEFGEITLALRTYYQPNGSSSIETLSQLIGLYSEGPDSLDAAVTKALQKVGTKEVLPAMVLLLDSPNPLVKGSACWYFHYYTALAGPDGNINRTGNGQHPFFNEETRSHIVRKNDDLDSAADIHAAFWKSWWTENKEKLGFETTTSSQ